MTRPAVDVVGIGLCTVDHLFCLEKPPGFRGSGRAKGFVRQGGGPVPTALVTLARLGNSTRFIGRVGDDAEGDFIGQGLRQEGVDTAGLRVEPGSLSRVALVLVEHSSGERGFTGRPETCQPLTSTDIEPQEILSARLLHIDDADEACLAAAGIAHQAGIPVCFDGTWDHEDLDRLLPLIDLAVVSEPFLRAWMPGATPAQVLDRLWSYAPRLAVLTLGAGGCVARWDAGSFAFDAFDVPIVDTTGAGDAFHGGLIHGYLNSMAWPDALRFASAIAALNCRQLGGRSALPSLKEVETFLGQRADQCRPTSL